MAELTDRILSAMQRKGYQPLKPKALARKLGLSTPQFPEFRRALRSLVREGRVEIAQNQTLRMPAPHGTIVGTFRRTSTGVGYVRPNPSGTHTGDTRTGPDVKINENDTQDAATGDTVLVRLTRKPNRPDISPLGKVMRVLERATRQFVGTYFERDGHGFVRVDGTVFSHSIDVGDPGAKGAKPDDKVVFEMVRFPTPEDRGEGVITEILGPRGQPGVDTLSVIRAFNLPDAFPPDALEEARLATETFREDDLAGRTDFTKDLIVTIDPVEARDFDDAISLTREPKNGHWELQVHIADVGHFAPAGGPLDREARKRATSVYLPQRVIPMFPELISNHLASLQEGKVRYVKSVLISFTPEGQVTGVRFANGAIRVRRRFTYEEAMAVYQAHPLEEGHEEAPKVGKETVKKTRKGKGKESDERPVAESQVAERPVAKRSRAKKAVAETQSDGTQAAESQAVESPAAPALEPEVRDLLLRMRELALILRGRRRKRGALELTMPEAELEYDDQGRVVGGHFRSNDVSHQVIEEFMLAANEAVAGHLDSLGTTFLRRVHPDPDPFKLAAFAEFARSLGYKMNSDADRFALQRILEGSADEPEAHAVHYALLRSLKQAVYSPVNEPHYALASDDYCHFTSPIRRYPDLTVHRQLDQWLRTGRAGGAEQELLALGDHCSKMERRAEMAERELVKQRMLAYMSERLGMELDVIITGVADYGFFAQAQTLPVEGLVHISTLMDDYYYYDESTHSLTGRRTGRHYQLGNKIRVTVVRVDMQRRQLDFRVVEETPKRREASDERPKWREGRRRNWDREGSD